MFPSPAKRAGAARESRLRIGYWGEESRSLASRVMTIPDTTLCKAQQSPAFSNQLGDLFQGIYASPDFPAFSARLRRCAGCTNHAMAMLNRYKTIIGAAKMHMFMMSVVGVMTAAMMKMTRME